MTDELLLAQAKWLPQYKKGIAKIKRRVAREGWKIKTNKSYRGAARLKQATQKELAKRARDRRKKAASELQGTKHIDDK
ncbi:MAG: hypothetical protein JKY51_04320 [Opitutaceae bacterium]|nr:hypothetical protein [Opitutaceae bacterium]